MNDSFAYLYNKYTIVVEPPPDRRVPIENTEIIILEGLKQRLMGNPNFKPYTLDTEIIKIILEANKDLTTLSTYDNTPFQAILLLKQENIFNTKGLILTCINNLITPLMIAKYSIKQLLHYSYTIGNDPFIINRAIKPRPVTLYNDYYKDILDYQQRTWFTYRLT